MKVPVAIKVGDRWVPVVYSKLPIEGDSDCEISAKYSRKEDVITVCPDLHASADSLFCSVLHECLHAGLRDAGLGRDQEEALVEQLEIKLGPVLAFRDTGLIKYGVITFDPEE